MHGTGRAVNPTRELEDALRAKRDRAVELGVADDHGGRTDVGLSIILSGENGAVRATVGGDGMRLFMSHTPQQHYIVDIIDGVVSYPFDDGSLLSVRPISELVLLLTDLIKPMEVAPQVQVPYGFVSDDQIMGFTFMTEVDGNDQKGERRDGLGLNMDTYFVHDPHGLFTFVGEKDPANWLRNFWQAVAHGQVVNLSTRIRDLTSDFWAYQNGPDVWIEFDTTDGAVPAFVTGQRYRSWDPVKNNFSSHQRRGNATQKNRLNDWFG